MYDNYQIALGLASTFLLVLFPLGVAMWADSNIAKDDRQAEKAESDFFKRQCEQERLALAEARSRPPR